MSVVGSVISTCSSVRSAENDTDSRVQKCTDLRDRLGLDAFVTKKNEKLPVGRPYVQISSKTLRENYVVPADGHAVEGLFLKLEELMRDCKKSNRKPPRTDFTCLSRAAKRKVWVDIDCLACKRGEQIEDTRHFKMTRLVAVIIATLENTFDITITDGVYLTNGKNTCGFHIFFNTLAYDSNTAATVELTLMDALNNAFRRAKITNAGVDRGCTQMPLPTSTHSNSTSNTRPYRIVNLGETKWNKVRLNWTDMDVETLKCFSSIAFTGLYAVTELEPPLFRTPGVFKRKRECFSDDSEHDNGAKRANNGIGTCIIPPFGDPMSTEDSKGPVSEEDQTPGSEDLCRVTHDPDHHATDDGGDFDLETSSETRLHPPEPRHEKNNKVITTISPPSSPSHSSLLRQGDSVKQPVCPPTLKPDCSKFDEDEVSLLSKYTESSLISSFRCRSVTVNPPYAERKKKITNKHEVNDTSLSPPSAPSLNAIERLPYECEDDKTSAFADKQYKASILCAEEEEAAVSKARLNGERRTTANGNKRVYITDGSGSNVTREYKLLVQLANVNRAVYQDDIVSGREWTDLLVSYYDQHLHNPVLLAIFQFIFRDEDVVKVFPHRELECIVTSVVSLMTPFKQMGDRGNVTNVDRPFCEAEFEREARPHKVRLVGAVIRVCTHLLNMTTAVYSDLWKIQKANERKDMSSLNRTVVKSNAACGFHPAQPGFDEDLDCSASMIDGEKDYPDNNTGRAVSNNYTLLASLIVYEQINLSDMSLYALLYYYHSFPFGAIDRIMEEIHHEGLMVTAVIRYFLMYDHKNGKTLTLQEIFEGFNDCVIFLKGPESFIKARRKVQKRGGDTKKNNAAKTAKNKDPNFKKRNRNNRGGDGGSDNTETVCDIEEGEGESFGGDVTPEEINLLLGKDGRRRKMCGAKNGDATSGFAYEYKDKHLWEAVINYYLRPVSIYDDKMVFANDNYDTLEEDAIESSVAHLATSNKNTKGDVQTAFKDARTAWRMPHGSQLIYESDLRSDRLGCCFHINIALKMYEMFCGGCVTRMKRVHKNYLIDRTRFNMTVYDVVAECRTATVNLTAAIDKSYMNLLLRQPIVPPFLEEKEEVRRLYMSSDAIDSGSFCCLSVMDYNRALNLFERSNYKCKSELETCDYVERFLNDLYTNEIAAEHTPNPAAGFKTRLLYAFYTLYLFEVVFNMRHVYAKREHIFVPLERLCGELDIRELIILFFGESSMDRVEGLDGGIEHRIRAVADDWKSAKRSSGEDDSVGSAAGGRFDVRPVLAAEIPDKMLRMKTLFGQFGFDVMQDCSSDGVDEGDIDGDTAVAADVVDTDSHNSFASDESLNGASRVWDDETKFEQEFYSAADWLETARERMLDKKVIGKTHRKNPTVVSSSSSSGCGENTFARETLRTIMRLETKRHINNDRLGKLMDAAKTGDGTFDAAMSAARNLPMRLKLLAFILTTHTIKSKNNTLCPDLVESVYREADGRFSDESRVYEGETNFTTVHESDGRDPPEKVWCRKTRDLIPSDRLPLLLHARWLADRRFDLNFFVGLDPVRVYSVLYDYMKKNADRYPSFGEFEKTEGEAAKNLCTAVMFVLIMSAYDQEHVDLYLKVFLAVEWPGQWAKTIFVWKSNSNAGKSYLFDAIVKRACANSTCINDPKGGKENAPEKAEYVRNFVLFANEFSQANSNELKKIVSESTFKFRMNYGNVMNEAYATGKIMFNCNTLPPTSDEAAINRLTLFDIPFWFCRRQKISDAMLNWIRGTNPSSARWEIAYRHELPSLLTAEERVWLKSNDDTKDELDLFDEDAAVRRNILPTEYNKPTASLFLVQNKTSRLYVSSSPPTDRIVQGLVNITTHFSWLRFFKRLDTPVDFTTLPASSEAVRSEWLSLTLPYQEWKKATRARTDTNPIPAESIYRSLQAFASKKNINYFGIKQFFETDFASSREAIKDEYYIWFDSKAFRD